MVGLGVMCANVELQRQIILAHICEWKSVMGHSNGQTQECRCGMQIIITPEGEIIPVVGSVPLAILYLTDSG